LIRLPASNREPGPPTQILPPILSSVYRLLALQGQPRPWRGENQALQDGLKIPES
jgi:hypothetical protein